MAVVVFFYTKGDLVDIVGGVGGLDLAFTKYRRVVVPDFHNRMRGLFPEDVVQLPLAHHAS